MKCEDATRTMAASDAPADLSLKNLCMGVECGNARIFKLPIFSVPLRYVVVYLQTTRGHTHLGQRSGLGLGGSRGGVGGWGGLINFQVRGTQRPLPQGQRNELFNWPIGLSFWKLVSALLLLALKQVSKNSVLTNVNFFFFHLTLNNSNFLLRALGAGCFFLTC